MSEKAKEALERYQKYKAEFSKSTRLEIVLFRLIFTEAAAAVEGHIRSGRKKPPPEIELAERAIDYIEFLKNSVIFSLDILDTGEQKIKLAEDLADGILTRTQYDFLLEIQAQVQEEVDALNKLRREMKEEQERKRRHPTPYISGM